MLVQKGGAELEISVLGPKPDVILPHYEGSRGPSPDVAGQSSAEAQESRILIIQSEKPDIELPLYRRYGSPDTPGSAGQLDWSANIRADSPDPQYEVVGGKSSVPQNLDWSAKIESQGPDERSVPTHRIQSPESKVMEWSADLYAFRKEQTIPPSPIVVEQKVPTLAYSWTPKDDEELKLDMQQDNVIHRINSMSMRRKTRKRKSLAATIRQKMFRKAEVVEYTPAKTGAPIQTKRKSVRDEVAVNMMNVYRMQQQNKAREMEFSFATDAEPLPIVPPLAKEFYEKAQLVKTETGELAYELDEEESSLLRNCGKHPYLRRSETEPRALGLLGSPERTEFGSVIRRSGTVCLPTNNQLSETELNSLAEFMGYKKLCQLEKQYETGDVTQIDRRVSSVEQIVQLPREECLIPTPPPSTPTPTPPPSPDEYTPMQYQYSVPETKVEVATEETVSSASRQYTEVITPPTVTPIPEEEEEEEEEMEEKERTEIVMKTRDTPSSMSFRGASRASHKSPQPLEVETKEQRSHSTVSSNSFCGKLVDEVLLRINFEKEETEVARKASPTVPKNLTYTIERIATDRESSSSSVRSHSSIETEKQLASTSPLLKYPSPIPSITVKEPTAAAGQFEVGSLRSHSSASKSDMTIRSFGTDSRISRVSNISEASERSHHGNRSRSGSIEREPNQKEQTLSPSPIQKDPTPSPSPIQKDPTPSPSPIQKDPTPFPSPIQKDPTPSPSPIQKDPTPSPSPIQKDPTPSPSPIQKDPTPSPSPIQKDPAPSPSPIQKDPTPSPIQKEPIPAVLTSDRPPLPPSDKNTTIELFRDDTATTSFVSGVALSCHSSLREQTLTGPDSESDSSESYTRTPDIWKLTPLPPLQQSRGSSYEGASQSPGVQSPARSRGSSSMSRPQSKGSPRSSEASPAQEDSKSASETISSDKTPTPASAWTHDTSETSSRSSHTLVARAHSSQSPAGGSYHTPNREAESNVGAYSDDFESEEEKEVSASPDPPLQLSATPDPPLQLSATPVPLLKLSATPVPPPRISASPVPSPHLSAAPVPSPLFIKRSPPVIRTPSPDQGVRERMGREKTAPAGLEREGPAWQPLSPHPPSRLSTVAPTSQPHITIFSLSKAHTHMHRWKATLKTPNRYLRRRIKIELNPDSPYIMHDIDKNIAVQAAQEQVESSTAEAFRLENFMKYKKRLKKMSQKKRIEELTKEDIRKTEITENVYLRGKAMTNNKLAPLTPPRSPVSSDTAASASPDEKEGFDTEKDKGLIKIIDQIRSLTNASIGEMKTYKSPPPDVHAVVKCVFMILGEDPRRLEHWQECVILLSKLGRKHVRRRVLRMRKDRVTPQIRENARKILAGWTSYDIAQRSRVCVLFFIWCKEICDLNDRPEDNPLLPVVVGRFLNQQNNNAVMSRIFSNRRNSPGLLPGEENPRMVLAAARAFKMNRANKRNTLPPVVRTPASARTPA